MQNNNIQNGIWKQTLLPIISLFSSVSTLLCCTLPALFVTLGMGATLAGFVSHAPWITVLSSHKTWIFLGSGLMLVVATWMQWRARKLPCPAAPQKAKACSILRKVSWGILIFSIIIYCIGFFFAFIAANLFYG